MRENDYLVYSCKCARFLIDRGFELKDTIPNYKDIRKDVYIFENSQALYDAIGEYIKSTQRR